MGGTDLAASFAGSSSATSGLRSDNQFNYGDIVVGGPKPNPPWLTLAFGGLILAGLVVWLLRKN